MIETTFSVNLQTERSMKPDGESFFMYKGNDGKYDFNMEFDSTFDLSAINGAPLKLPFTTVGLGGGGSSALPDDECQSAHYEVTEIITDTYGLESQGGAETGMDMMKFTANPETPSLHRCQQRHPYDPVAQACCVMTQHQESAQYTGWENLQAWFDKSAPECGAEDPTACCVLQNQPKSPGDPLPYVDYESDLPVVNNATFDPNSELCECLEERENWQQATASFDAGDIIAAAYIAAYEAYYCDCTEGALDPMGWCQEPSCDDLFTDEQKLDPGYAEAYECCEENDGNIVAMLANCPEGDTPEEKADDCGNLIEISLVGDIAEGAEITIGDVNINNVQACCQIINNTGEQFDNSYAFNKACQIGEKSDPCELFYNTYGVLPPECILQPGGEIVGPTAALACGSEAFQVLDEDGNAAQTDKNGKIEIEQFRSYSFVIDPNVAAAPGQPSIASIIKGQTVVTDPDVVKPQAVVTPSVELIWTGTAPTVDSVSEATISYSNADDAFKANKAVLASGSFIGTKKVEIVFTGRPPVGTRSSKQAVAAGVTITDPLGKTMLTTCNMTLKGGIEGGGCTLTRTADSRKTAPLAMALILGLAFIPLSWLRRQKVRARR